MSPRVSNQQRLLTQSFYPSPATGIITHTAIHETGVSSINRRYTTVFSHSSVLLYVHVDHFLSIYVCLSQMTSLPRCYRLSFNSLSWFLCFHRYDPKRASLFAVCDTKSHIRSTATTANNWRSCTLSAKWITILTYGLQKRFSLNSCRTPPQTLSFTAYLWNCSQLHVYWHKM